MTATAADLALFVGVPSATAQVVSAWDTAVVLVDGYVGSWSQSIPLEVLDRAYLETGAALFRRKQASGAGGAQFATADGSPVMYARDPMVTVYPLFASYLGGGIA